MEAVRSVRAKMDVPASFYHDLIKSPCLPASDARRLVLWPSWRCLPFTGVTAVPFLEPARQIKKVASVSPSQRLAVSQNRLGGYARFFPDGSWERDNPIILESETSRLLFKEYTTLPDGHLKLNPCTLIYLPEGDAEATDSHKRVIILQAPEGAELKFDQPVDLSRGKIGRLEGGVMSGR